MKSKLGIIFVVLVITKGILAQEGILPSIRRTYISTGFSYQMWRVGGYVNPISQASFPFSIMFPMGRRFNLTISHTAALSHWYEDTKINGFSDTWFQGTYIFWDEKGMINLGLGAPTGKTRLTNNEFLLSNWLGLNIFRFRVPVYGQGLCGKLGFAIAYPILENLVVGFGGQYLHKRPFHPISYRTSYYLNSLDSTVVSTWEGEYKPGDEATVNVGLDFGITENMKIMFDGIYTYYWRDLRSGQEVYGSGQKISMNWGYLYRFGVNYLWSRFTYRHKGKNEIATYYGIVSIEEEAQNSNGPQMELDIVLKAMDIDGSGIFLYGDIRYYDRNEVDETGKALVFGGGFGANVKLTNSTMLDFRFEYHGGSLTTTEDRNIEGISTFLGLRFEI